MKLVALSLVLSLALLVAGCGDSTGTTTVSGSAALELQLGPVARQMRDSPETIAYEKALKGLDGNRDLAELRQHTEDLLPKMTAYIRFLGSLDFPTCFRPVQRRATRFLAESRSMTRASIPVLEAGDEDLAFAYLEKVHELTKKEKAALEGLQRRLVRTVEEGGDGAC